MAVNPDLTRERVGCPFDQEELTYHLDGGREKTEKRRRIEREFLSPKVHSKDFKKAVQHEPAFRILLRHNALLPIM